MLILDVPHLGDSGLWGRALPRSGDPAPCPVPPLPSSTYMLQLEQDFARQLDPLAVEVLHGHQVALGAGKVVGARWAGGTWWGGGHPAPLPCPHTL